MKKEDKELLLKDLCARLPYSVILNVTLKDKYDEIVNRNIKLTNDNLTYITRDSHWMTYKPYLRPMSSMTEEEVNEFTQFDIYADGKYVMPNYEVIDWLNKYHFDYRGLIPMDLAIEVTEDNNPYK